MHNLLAMQWIHAEIWTNHVLTFCQSQTAFYVEFIYFNLFRLPYLHHVFVLISNYSFNSRMENQREIPVYNYVYDQNNLTWGKYMAFVEKGLHSPFHKAVW